MQSKKGFTLIEIAVAILVISIITAITLFGYENFTARSTIRSIGQEIVASARLAQTQATGAVVESSNKELGSYTLKLIVNDGKLETYGIHFSETTEDLHLAQKTAVTANPSSTIFDDAIYSYTVNESIGLDLTACFIVPGTPEAGYQCIYVPDEFNPPTTTYFSSTYGDFEVNVVFTHSGLDVSGYVVKLNDSDFGKELFDSSEALNKGEEWGIRIMLTTLGGGADGGVTVDFLRTGEVSLK